MTTIPSRPMTAVEGLVHEDGRTWYAIPSVERMAPFLMSVVSDGDRWMFASSSGALTAGRRDANQALFPYETDDRLHRAGRQIGGVTSVRIDGDLWRPFDPATPAPPARRILKSVEGDAVVFEEREPEGRLVVRTRWASCEAFGFVRTTTLVNTTDTAIEVEVVDGLLRVLPYGLEPATTQRLSNLSNAYRRSEVLDADARLAVYTIESPVSDQAEPEEVLRATTVWSVGLGGVLSLGTDDLSAFDRGEAFGGAAVLTGRPGSYLLRQSLSLPARGEQRWHIVADAARDHRDLSELRGRLHSTDLDREIEAALVEATTNLGRVIALADGRQHTGDTVASAHHFANVTYNVMRGGVPLRGYHHDADDLRRFVTGRNRHVATRHAAWLAGLPDTIERSDLLQRAAEQGDPQLDRLLAEYLPFSFSRRHGDPSRPWNSFSIRVRDDAGRPVVHYEGNWRDLFQNWEALGASYPEYLAGMVSVFVNASTVDGFNPYRITSDGIDWEVPDPHDPWANIGYWGDHQLVYLQRLLDGLERHAPGELVRMAAERRHSYAAVPYRLAPYDELVRDPKGTIEFDAERNAAAEALAARLGADGKLVLGDDGEPVLATLLEKLLVTSLSKLSNFVPGGGIWMNTQRPEWNDANNALVGYGVSMVTLYHLRSFLGRMRDLAGRVGEPVAVSAEVADWMRAVGEVLAATPVAGDDDDLHRKQMMDALGEPFSSYRQRVYEQGFSGATAHVSEADVAALCGAALGHIDATIHSARRSDGLYHAYNLLRFAPDRSSVAIEHLAEMLEGQVAVLGCGALSPADQVEVLDALFASALYRSDQHSFLLYPAERLPSFVDKNVIDRELCEANALLTEMIAAGDTRLVVRDADGVVRFHPDLVDESALVAALDRVAADAAWSDLVEAWRQVTLDDFERVFRHRAFTGRSGSMYAYEGLGSIYWHMVGKLLLAVQEVAVAAADVDADPATVGRLIDHYWSVREGLGFNKSAEEFGAVPTDPYSHTPAHAGAQQPGMTGAVKEELLARWLELGLRVVDGEIVVSPLFVHERERLAGADHWTVPDAIGGAAEVDLPAGGFGFTFCRVPFVVAPSAGETSFEIHRADGRIEQVHGGRLGAELSAEIFGHTGEVRRVTVRLPLA